MVPHSSTFYIYIYVFQLPHLTVSSSYPFTRSAASFVKLNRAYARSRPMIVIVVISMSKEQPFEDSSGVIRIPSSCHSSQKFCPIQIPACVPDCFHDAVFIVFQLHSFCLPRCIRKTHGFSFSFQIYHGFILKSMDFRFSSKVFIDNFRQCTYNMSVTNL